MKRSAGWMLAVLALAAVAGLYVLSGDGEDGSARSSREIAKPELVVPQARPPQEAEPTRKISGAPDVPFEASALYGRCLDTSGKPLVGVRVHLDGSDRTLESDSFGRFRFTGLEPLWTYTLVFEREGLCTLERAFASGHDFDVTLSSAGELRLRVVDAASGSAVRSGSVRVEAPVWRDKALVATVAADLDGQGEAVLGGMPMRGRVTVRARSEGYVTQRFDLKLASSDEHVLRLERAHLLTGQVVDRATRKGLAGARLLLPQGGERRADDDGRFAVPVLGDQELSLRVVAGDYCTLRRVLQPADFERGRELRLELRRGGTVRGRVVDREGVAVAGLGVALSDRHLREPVDAAFEVVEDGPSSWGKTDAQGAFECRGVRLSAVERRMELESSGWRIVRPALVRIEEEGQEVEVTLVVERPGWIEGRVTCAGRGVRAWVSWRSQAGDRGDGVWSNDGGDFRLEPVAPGAVWLRASPSPSPRGQAHALSVAPGRGVSFDLTIPFEMTEISGHVHDTLGRAVVGARVFVSADGEEGYERQQDNTNDAGEFSIRLPHLPGRAWALSVHSAAGRTTFGEVYTPATGLGLEVPAAGHVAVRPVDARTGEPIEGHFASRWRAAGTDRWVSSASLDDWSNLDADGMVVFAVPVGVIDVEVKPYTSNHFAAVLLGVSVSAVQDDAIPVHEIALERGVELHVRYRSVGATSEPPRLDVVLEPVGWEGVDYSANPAPTGMARTGGVVPGEYRLRDRLGSTVLEPSEVSVDFALADENGVQRIEVGFRSAGGG